MNPNWNLTQSQAMLNPDQYDFFHLVPPTPDMVSIQAGSSMFPLAHPPMPSLNKTQATSIAPRQMYVDPRFNNTPHLRPAPAFASWRSHKSTSSIDSQSSHVSGGWESLLGGQAGSETSESGSGRDVEPANPFDSIPFGQQGVQGSGVQAGLSANPQRRTASLSIDPNLFRPKSTQIEISTEPQGTAAAATTQGAVEEERVATAWPSKKGRAGGDRGKASPRTASQKSSHARKQDSDHIPRPRNAFILFRKHVVDSKLIPPSVEIRHQNVSVIVAKMWAEAPQAQKDEFNQLAKIEKEEHMEKYPGYRYQPVYRRTNVIRRRVRKNEAEEEKCKNVAELLLKGKSGEELEVEIKEKLNQPLIPVARGDKSRRSGMANELSKGAIRALRAQARQQANSEHSYTLQSRSQSVASSRASSEEADDASSRRESIVSELAPKLDGFAFQSGLSLGLGGRVFQGMDGPMFGTQQRGMQSWAPIQQTWAYPQEENNTMQQMAVAYQQPAANDALVMYDQALPFSPTTQAFNQAFTFPSQPLNSMPPPPQYGLKQSYQMSMGASADTSFQYASDPAIPAWDGLYQPGSEGLSFDETLFLGDFGAALMQAEGTGAW